MSLFKDPEDLSTRLKNQALKNKAPAFVRKLVSSKCWPEVCEKLSNSENIKTIADFVQQTELTEYTRASFIRQMYMFCEYFENEFGKNQTPNTFEGLVNTVASRVDPVDALYYLLNIQADRVHASYLAEKKSKKIDEKITNNIKVFVEIVKSISTVQNEKSNSDKQSGAIDPTEQMEKQKKIYEEKFGEVGAKILSNPDSRKRVLHVVEMMTSNANIKSSSK